MSIYKELGITPFVNGYKPLTRLGGGIMPECVIEAMKEASRESVTLETMQEKVGEAIASLTRNEAAYVSCGAASGITLAIAACMAGTDPALSERLPNTNGMKNKVIMHLCERGYTSDVAIRCAGASIVDIGNDHGATVENLRNAIDERTAAILVHDSAERGKIPLEQIIAVARTQHLPVLIDGGFSVPPRDNLWKFTRDLGADAVFISGGKGLRGPQSTGLVLGKTWIVNGCAFHGNPNHRIGRGMKVGKEELAGIYAAVKFFLAQDEKQMLATMMKQLEFIVSAVEGLPSVRIMRLGGTKAKICFDSTVYGFSPVLASRRLLGAVPPVYLEPSIDGLIFSTECLEAGHEAIIGSQLQKLFHVP